MIAKVPAGHAYVVERLGRYHRTLDAGWHMLAPVVDRVAFRFSLAPQETQFATTAISHDNVPIRFTTTVRWQIADAQLAAYGSANAKDFVTTLVESRQREWVAQHDAGDLRETSRERHASVLRACADAARQVGVTLLELK